MPQVQYYSRRDRKTGNLIWYVRQYMFDKIDVKNLTEENLFYRIDVKGMNTRWLKKLTIINEGNRVVWKYKNRKPLFIFEDGIYMDIDDVKNLVLDDYYSVYRCASILAEHGFAENFRYLKGRRVDLK